MTVSCVSLRIATAIPLEANNAGSARVRRILAWGPVKNGVACTLRSPRNPMFHESEIGLVALSDKPRTFLTRSEAPS